MSGALSALSRLRPWRRRGAEPPGMPVGRRTRSDRFLLAFCLAIQALLMFWRLDLLPARTDEGHTLEVAPLPPREIARHGAADIHPPVYFWSAHGWLRLPLPGEPLSRLRALSGLFVLLTTLLVRRLWLARADLS